MPLAKATLEPIVTEVKEQTTQYASRQVVADEKVAGQIRTHMAAHAVPILLASINVSDFNATKEVLNRLTQYALTGE